MRDVSDECVVECAQDLEAIVKSPTGKEIPTMIKEIGEGRYSVAFVPDVVGEHAVSVMVAGEPVPHSPYKYVTMYRCCTHMYTILQLDAAMHFMYLEFKGL